MGAAGYSVLLIGVIAALVLLERHVGGTRANVRAAAETPGFMTDDERQFFVTAASLDQANHLMMSVHRRRHAELAAWLEQHHQRHPLWKMVHPDGRTVIVEVHDLGDFDKAIPVPGPSWQWDLAAPQLVAARRRRRWTFAPADAVEVPAGP